jgi:hypothetical protein
MAAGSSPRFGAPYPNRRPELASGRFVLGHVRLSDGHFIVTLDVIDLRLLLHRQIEIETLNTRYILGDPGTDELPAEYSAVIDEILGQAWRQVGLGDL